MEITVTVLQFERKYDNLILETSNYLLQELITFSCAFQCATDPNDRYVNSMNYQHLMFSLQTITV